MTGYIVMHVKVSLLKGRLNFLIEQQLCHKIDISHPSNKLLILQEYGLIKKKLIIFKHNELLSKNSQ